MSKCVQNGYGIDKGYCWRTGREARRRMLYAIRALGSNVVIGQTQANQTRTKRTETVGHSVPYPTRSTVIESLSSSSASFRPSSLPRSTSTAAISGIGSASRTARNQNATLMSPYLSVSAPTMVGPKMLEPLSVTA